MIFKYKYWGWEKPMEEEQKNPLISVVIPVYNMNKYLDRCMKSVCNQTYHNLEIILVDDGSTDGSGILCDEWAERDARIKVIHKKNGGLSSARNAGLDNARGEYIGYVDSDDWIDVEMYLHLFTILQNYQVDVVFCDFYRFKKNVPVKNVKETVILREDKEIDDFFYRVKGGKSSYGVWCGLYKKEKIDGIRFAEGKISEDVLYRYEVYQVIRRIAFSSLPLYYYFINSQGITGSPLCKRDLSLLEIWDEIVRREKENVNNYNALLNRKRAVFTLYAKKVLFGNKDVDEDVIKGWKKELKDSYHELIMSSMLDWKRKLLLYMLVKF